MKLTLVHTPFPCNTRHKKVLPLGILYLAAFLRREMVELEVSIIDGQAPNLTYEELLRLTLCEEPDVVGFGYWTVQAEISQQLSNELKKKRPDVLIVHGGIHPTIFPEEALRHCDAVVMREAELTMLELLERYKRGERFSGVQGLVHTDNGKVVYEEPRPFIKDLDSLPFPAWDLVDLEKYNTQFHVYGGIRIPVMGSRGCPYNCAYCGSPIMWKRRVRYRSPQNVVEEIRTIKEKFSIDQIHFWDDNLFMKRSYIERLLTLMVSEKFGVRWTGLTRASHLKKNFDLMPLAKESGCIGMEIGIESANPETFQQIHKHEDLETLLQVSEVQKKYGMYPMYTYMAFNPGETIHGYYLQGKFIDSLLSGLPWAEHFHPLPFPLYIGQMCTPHPGTELFNQAHKHGEIRAARWSHYYHHRVNFIPNSLLEDIPQRNVYKLRNENLAVILLGIYAGLYEPFYEKTLFEKILVAYDLVRLSQMLFEEIDGSSTVREICGKIQSELESSIDSEDMDEYLVLIVLIMGEMGWIKSGRLGETESVTPKVVCHSLISSLKYKVVLIDRFGGVYRRFYKGFLPIWNLVNRNKYGSRLGLLWRNIDRYGVAVVKGVFRKINDITSARI